MTDKVRCYVAADGTLRAVLRGLGPRLLERISPEHRERVGRDREVMLVIGTSQAGPGLARVIEVGTGLEYPADVSRFGPVRNESHVCGRDC